MSDLAARCPYCLIESPLSFRHGEQRMTECQSCKAWFVWPPPAPADIVSHYHQNAAGMPAQLREWRTGTSQEKWYAHLARRIAARTSAVRSIADIGAGGLELTVSLARQFPHARVEAWDLFADGTDRSLPDDVAARVSLRPIDLNDASQQIPSAAFDVIACVAVIEHVLNPLALLLSVRSLLAPGGLAFVVGPEVTSVAHRIMGRAWPYYCPDEHLTLPGLQSIRKAVAHCGGGPYELHRVNVHYSLRYLIRFLHLPLTVPAALDFLLPFPAGAFELIWRKEVTGGNAAE